MNSLPPERAALTDALGYFGPDTVTWQLYREPLFVLGGVRALLLQVAHPAVADGVARFSNFQSDPFGRGYRTFAAMATVYFGSRTQAEQTARHLWRIHSAIRGHVPAPYTANDPPLLSWVLATLTDTTLQVYEQAQFLRLPPDWPARFCEESRVAARLLGIPEEVYPQDLAAFRTYMQQMLQGDLLGSTPVCREVAQAIVQHPHAPQHLARLMAAGGLPPALCQRLGMAPLPDAEARWQRWQCRFHGAYRLLPKGLRWCPAYHQAQHRIAKAKGNSAAWAGRFYHFLSGKVKVPLGLERPA